MNWNATESWTKATLTFVRSWEKNCTGAATNCNVKSGCRRGEKWPLGNGKRKKTDPMRLTRPLDTNEYITIYSTNTLKYILHARRTNIQKSQRAKTKDANKRAFSSLQHIFRLRYPNEVGQNITGIMLDINSPIF